jgi:hypothetical protein
VKLFYKKMQIVSVTKDKEKKYVNKSVETLSLTVLIMKVGNHSYMCRVAQKSVSLKHFLVLTGMFRFKRAISL